MLTTHPHAAPSTPCAPATTWTSSSPSLSGSMSLPCPWSTTTSPRWGSSPHPTAPASGQKQGDTPGMARAGVLPSGMALPCELGAPGLQPCLSPHSCLWGTWKWGRNKEFFLSNGRKFPGPAAPRAFPAPREVPSGNAGWGVSPSPASQTGLHSPGTARRREGGFLLASPASH